MERYIGCLRNGSARKHCAIDSRLCSRNRESQDKDDIRGREKWRPRALDVLVKVKKT